MTLAQLIAKMEAVALAQPSVRSVVRNDVFRLNSDPDTAYGVFAFTQGQHRANLDNDMMTYVFTLFYVDRLTEDSGNEVEVQSTGVSTLANIIRTLADDFGVYTWTVDTFNQRFKDLCAGAFAAVSIEIPIDYTCADTFTPSQNGNDQIDG